jgi:hypothetical protein
LRISCKYTFKYCSCISISKFWAQKILKFIYFIIIEWNASKNGGRCWCAMMSFHLWWWCVWWQVLFADLPGAGSFLDSSTALARWHGS